MLKAEKVKIVIFQTTRIDILETCCNGEITVRVPLEFIDCEFKSENAALFLYPYLSEKLVL
jgi:hypothetical protein